MANHRVYPTRPAESGGLSFSRPHAPEVALGSHQHRRQGKRTQRRGSARGAPRVGRAFLRRAHALGTRHHAARCPRRTACSLPMAHGGAELAPRARRRQSFRATRRLGLGTDSGSGGRRCPRSSARKSGTSAASFANAGRLAAKSARQKAAPTALRRVDRRAGRDQRPRLAWRAGALRPKAAGHVRWSAKRRLRPALWPSVLMRAGLGAGKRRRPGIGVLTSSR